MYDAYGIQHEQFVWDIRTEPGVVNAFATLWGTEKLVSSFDGVTVMLPQNPKPKELVGVRRNGSPSPADPTVLAPHRPVTPSCGLLRCAGAC
jgi:hypothetical protein